MRACCVLLLIVVALQSFSQSPDVLKIGKWRTQHEAALMKEYITFLAIPNVASDSANIQNNAVFIQQMMRQRKIGNVQLLYGSESNGPDGNDF